jgi:hypothetical protein
MCKVVNVKQIGKWPIAKWPPENCVYVGRTAKWGGTKWGNPFKIGRDGSRDQVIAKYRAWIVRQTELMDALDELRGKDLACHCAPERCHADVLLELANQCDETPSF